jgi:hypothetical protein
MYLVALLLSLSTQIALGKNVGLNKASPIVITSNKVLKTNNITDDGIFARLNNKGDYALTYYGLMLAGAIARSVSATAVHPLNVIKTMLQKRNGKFPEFTWRTLSRGAGSQFIMSVPHGAFNFAVTEVMTEFIDHFLFINIKI